MPLNYYTGSPAQARSQPVQLPASMLSDQRRPEGYRPQPDLVKAVNVALILGQPLLLTGEPGTGKTQLAFSVAHELGFYPPLVFETKSSSTSRDLFYTYDTIGRFHAAQTGEGSRHSKDYITFNALGIAILKACDRADLAEWVPDNFDLGTRGRSVVLVDEIDKAPRDFPNDILNEVEGMYFKVPELGNQVFRADPASRPILILTSNSEKNLPEAFLRRCVYYHIKFPDEAQLAEIVASRINYFTAGGDRLLKDAIAFFNKLREPQTGMRKKPATAEFLSWLTWLRSKEVSVKNPLKKYSEIMVESFTTLVKNPEDQEKVRRVWEEWSGQQAP